ncbi:MAG: serine hydrolase [Planctomycetes bacterium]|nr:serine hydrolase [Planctomycetota bacterium]
MKMTAAIAILALLVPHSAPADDGGRFDVIIRGGRIVDGGGAPWYVADVAIRDGLIVRIGRLDGAETGRTIDAAGLVVAPGFVDMMGQTATPFLEDPASAKNLLTQGITTINAGEGASAAPLGDDDARSQGWKTFAEYFQLLEQAGLPVNVAQTVGHTQVRRIVLGDVDRRPTEDELAQMQALVRRAMEDGAIGVSTALIYPPAVYATTEEIAALARVAGEYGGRYFTHMRNEGDRLIEAIDEALEVGRQAGTPVHIFHLKAAGSANWGKMDLAIARIKAARAAGEQVTADIYPYINNGLGIAAFIHPRHFTRGIAPLQKSLDDESLRAQIRREMETEGGWENWFRHTGSDWDKVVLGSIRAQEYAQHSGRSVAEIARVTGEDPWDVFFKIARVGAFALPQTMSEANKLKLVKEEFVTFCTDVGPAGGSRIASHPRAFGSFPRLLARYVRELGAVSLEEAVSRMSAAAANELLAFDRGRIAVGQAADIVVFDYEKIGDRATFAEPQQLSTGVKHVLVNGVVVLDDGEFTGARPGRVLRGPGYDPARAAHEISTGTFDRRLESFDTLITDFMQRHRVPGAALAVTDRGRLVYARGYGYADLEARKPVEPTSLFRIASISKPITAVAILQLVEQGKLKLDDRVFDILKVEPHLEDGASFDERLREVTIRQLLEHTGGWDRNASFDPMFQPVRIAEAFKLPPPAGPEHIIRYMHGRRLDCNPGEKYAYSNYGYCLLGRAIESLTGKSYEEHVQASVLAPLGIRTIRIGRTRLEDRHAEEVRYYDPNRGRSVFAKDLNGEVPQPYGAWHLEAMDAHGGWIASAVDLAKFAAAFDDFKQCQLLKPASIRTMWARPQLPPSADGSAAPVYYACGWSVRELGAGKRNMWHTGSLPGTSTILVRRHDGRNWVVLFNARQSADIMHLAGAIDPLVHSAADAVTDWPQHDLFDAAR